jgi:hypothetical protein
MRNRWISGCVTAGVLALVASVPALPHAQAAAAAAGQAAPAQGRGRGAPPAVDADGNPVAGRGGRGAARPAPPSKPTPRLPDGRVNFGAPAGEKGFWNNGVGSPVGRNGSSLPTNPLLEDVPFRPWAKALYEYRRLRGGLDDPHVRCQPPGGMRFFTVPNGMEFIVQPELNRIILIAGENREWKRVAMEPGRKHPSEDNLNPSYFGDQIGHWEGDTLVVDTVGFAEKFWMIRGGLPHTKFLHLTERFTRTDFNTMKYEVTVDDKGAYTRPWTGGWTMPWQPNNYDGTPGGEIHEYFCIDNERDSEHFPDASENR